MNFVDGLAAVDPGSDWNAPTEHWGNYEESPVLISPGPLPKPKEQPVPNKVLFYLHSFHKSIYSMYLKA